MAGWDDLRFFLAVHRAGSLTAAARVLGCSQPTVGRRVAALARRHGAALLEARGGRLVLTPAGKRVLVRAERMEREADAIARDVDRLDERPQGAVRVSAPEGLGLFVLAPRLPAFRRANPGIDLLLASEAPVVDLIRREADLAVRFVRPRQHELVVRRLARVPFEPYAARAYLAERPRAGDALLGDDDLVDYHEDLSGSPESAWLKRRAPEGLVRVRVRTPLAVREAIAAGAGVGMLAPYLAADPALRKLAADAPLVRDLFLVYHRALRRTARVQIVARFVAECLADVDGRRTRASVSR
jgi:DNA-binding transcriptional LysR family regulator